jgi:hypothetical protein
MVRDDGQDFPRVVVQAPVSVVAFAISVAGQGLAPEIEANDDVVIDWDQTSAGRISLFVLLATQSAASAL